MSQRQFLLTASSLAKLSGAAMEEVERYTAFKLLPIASQSPLGTLYQPNAVSAIDFVRNLARLGFAPNEIRALVSVVEVAAGEMVSGIVRDRARAIREEIKALARLEEELAQFADRCAADRDYVAAAVMTPGRSGALRA